MSNNWPKYFQPHVVQGAYGAGRLSSFCIALEAWRRGLEVSIKHPNLYYFDVSDGDMTVEFNNSKPSPLTSPDAYQIVETKDKATRKLRAEGISAPDSVPFDAERDAYEDVLKAAERFGFPVVLKPIRGSMGNGVIAGIRDQVELKASHEWLVNMFGSRRFILEKFYEGGDHRVYVVGNRAVASGIKKPAYVIGDGLHSIRELIKVKNKVKRRNPFQSNSLIKQDFEVDSTLERLGYTYESIPHDGTEVRLRGKANVSAGGDFIDTTDELPKHIVDAAERSVAAFPGLAAAGVDVLYDPTKPVGEDYVILELNARAHIGLNMYPTYGPGQDVPKAILDAYFPASRRLEILDLDRITIDLPDVLGPVVSGSATEVKLRAIPENGFPVHEVISFAPEPNLKGSQRRKILSAQRSRPIFGRIDSSKGSAVIFGERDAVERFRLRLSDILNCEISTVEDWAGSMPMSFSIAK